MAVYPEKVETRIGQRTAPTTTISSDREDDDGDDQEDHNDSGISSFKTDFPQQSHYQQKKDSARSLDFGLRRTVPTPAPTLPPSPPPPPPVSASEHNRDYNRLVREKAKELEKQIELFEKENAKLQSLCKYEKAEVKQEKHIVERKRLDFMHQLQTMSKQSFAPPPPQQQLHDDTSSLSKTITSLVELQQTKQRPKNTEPTASKAQSLPKTMVVRDSEPPVKRIIISNGRRTPTAIIGVNGTESNVDISRKLSSFPTTKRPSSMNDLVSTMESVPIPTIIEPPIVISEAADFGNGESNDDSNRFDRKHNEHKIP
ncbi:unnamed protein product [Rotaria magnacalcarata]|uniref:Uncharacterized protein n=1 Tax=Rotaria magnacalcarata TaxID=392030 RepID=A0A816HGT6_9BILA|nr:unnamed protein product [Rotaria magnacalcarata]